MSFLHPWALAIGAVAVGLPILVHWLTRPRPVRLPLSTVRFVREAVHQRRAIHRLRDWIILALRTLAVLLLAWAFSRPLLGGRELLDDGEAGQVARVVVLDVSQSMGAVQRGIESFERARATAAEHLDGRSGLRAGLILAGAQPQHAFDSLSSNLAELRRELAEARPRPERCDAQQALIAAAELLGSAAGEAPRRELIVVTDLQASNWKTADFSVLPSDTVIRLESIAGHQVPGNLAVLRAGVVGRAESGRPVRLEVEVGNYSDTPRTVSVEVTLGPASYLLEGLCPVGGTTVLTTDAAVHEAGWLRGEARLVGVEDAMMADNARAFVVEARPRATYGLVTREDADRVPSSSYYLERALAPQAGRESAAGERVVRIAPSQIHREVLAGTDLLVIDRPGRLTAEAVNLLAAMVIRGKPMIYVASESTDADNLSLLSQAVGGDMTLPVEFAPASARQSRRGLMLAQYRRDVPPFSVFGPQAASIIEPLRLTRGLDSRAIDAGLRDDVLAVYSDGTAGLVWTACGAGSLAVLNVDLAESNLAQSTAFVPLLGELAGHPVARHGPAAGRSCGEPMTLWLPAEAGAAAGLTLLGDTAESRELGELVDEPTGVVWRWSHAGPPGVYEVQREGRTLLAVATGIPAEESDLRPLAQADVADRLAGGRAVHYRAVVGGVRQQDDFWTWIAVACAALMLVELAVLRVFKT